MELSIPVMRAVALLAPLWLGAASAHAQAIERLFATPNIIPTLFSSISFIPVR